VTWSIVAIAIVAAAGLTWFGWAASRGTGAAYRVVQWIYYRVDSLETYQRRGSRPATAADALAGDRAGPFGALIERIAPSQKGWFGKRFPTDKGGYHDYPALYDELLAPYRDKPGVWLLEVGVKKGGSLALWRELLREDAFIYGIDINPDVPRFSRYGHIKVLVLDSRDGDAVRSALGTLQFDIIIDDGLHEPEAQRKTFDVLWPHLKPNGLYVIEDVYEIDAARYAAPGVDMTVHSDRSGQQLVALRRSG
jgi:hypothetical protein